MADLTECSETGFHPYRHESTGLRILVYRELNFVVNANDVQDKSILGAWFETRCGQACKAVGDCGKGWPDELLVSVKEYRQSYKIVREDKLRNEASSVVKEDVKLRCKKCERTLTRLIRWTGAKPAITCNHCLGAADNGFTIHGDIVEVSDEWWPHDV